MGFDFLITTIVKQAWIFKNLKTMVTNLKNHWWGFGANFNTRPTLVILFETFGYGMLVVLLLYVDTLLSQMGVR